MTKDQALSAALHLTHSDAADWRKYIQDAAGVTILMADGRKLRFTNQELQDAYNNLRDNPPAQPVGADLGVGPIPTIPPSAPVAAPPRPATGPKIAARGKKGEPPTPNP